MNLLYFTIIIPLLSFLLLVCLGRRIYVKDTHIKNTHTKNRYIKPIGFENIVIIGISTIGLLCLLMFFVSVDYHTNSVSDTYLVYTRFLLIWFSIDGIEVPISLQLDGLSLVFLIVISFFSLLIYFFAAWYLTSTEDLYTFFVYGNLLILSLFLLILADNLFVLLVGWEGVGISCYLLIGIYYRTKKTSLSAIRWFIMTHIADIFLLVGVFLIYSELHTLNIREIITLASENLAVDSNIVFWVTLMLFIGVMGRAGLFPFHLSFAETVSAPMPATTLLQSFIAVLSGGYLVLRLNTLFTMSSDIFIVMGVIAGIAIIFSSCISLIQNDIKRLITYINLSQVSYIFLAFAVQNWVLSLNFMIGYGVTGSLLLLSSAILIKICNGERNIYKLGGLYRYYPLLYGCFILSAASLCAMPWVMSAFYTKGDIIWGLMMSNKTGLGIVALIGILLSTLSIFRLIFTVFHHKRKLSHYTHISRLSYLPLIILVFLSSVAFVDLPLPIQGIVPTILFDTKNQLAIQLLLAAVTILGTLIAYVLFCYPNSEINEIANTPIGRSLIRLWRSEWRFNRLLQFLVIRPYLSISQLIKKDPLSEWIYIISWGIKKVNFQVLSLENRRLRWHIMSIIVGSIMILLLLVLV